MILNWTGVREGEYEDSPILDNVLFFDGKEKGVRRAWVLDRRMERLGRLRSPVARDSVRQWRMARLAGRKDLEMGRRKYCLATRFEGPSGDVLALGGRRERRWDRRWEQRLERRSRRKVKMRMKM